jgi:hypothetical protein
MLNKKFNHRKWFRGSTMTVKEFLDYVLTASGDFYIKTKLKLIDNSLFDGTYEYFLTSEGGSFKLDKEDCIYLANNNEYFKERLKEAI